MIDEDRSTDANANPATKSPNSETSPPDGDDSIAKADGPYSTTVDEMIALSLVQDLLDCLQLSYTSSMLKSEIKSRINLNWSRRKIANVLQLDLDDSDANASDSSVITNRQDYSEDTFNEISNGSVNEASDSVKIESSNKTSASVEVTNKTVSDIKKTPLLVEILRRLPKTTDGPRSINEESSSNKNETTGEVNNETFVTASRSMSNQLSESF